MQTPDLFCDECGAANPRSALTCFACGCQLKPELASQTLDASPPEAEPEPAAPRYLQFILSPDSIMTIQLSQPPPEPALPPLLHERYDVLDKVGTGGFGAVYKARDTQHKNRLVAIKAIELDTLSAAQAIEATDTFNRKLNLLST